MTSLGRALWALAAAGFVFGLAVLALILTNDDLDVPGRGVPARWWWAGASSAWASSPGGGGPTTASGC